MKRHLFVVLITFFLQVASYAQYTLQSADVSIDDNGYITACGKTFSSGETDLIIPETLDGNTVKGIVDKSSEGTGVFDSKGLTSVTFPASMEYIGERAFEYNSITSIDLSLCSLLTSIYDFAFWSNDIESIDFTNCTALAYIGWCTFSESNLTSVDLSHCAALTTISKFAFYNNAITTLTLSESLNYLDAACFTKNQITTINGASNNGVIYALKSDGSIDSAIIVAYGGVSSNIDFIPEKVVEIGSCAFYGTDIASFDLSNTKSLKIVGERCFQYANIDTIDFTACTALEFIGDDAFNQTEVTSFYLPVTKKAGYEFTGWKKEDDTDVELAGNYFLADTVRSSYTATFNTIITLVEQKDLTSKIKVWPNPANEKVCIETDEVLSTIELLNLQGRILKVYKPSSKIVEIKLEVYDQGLLIFRLTDLNGKKSVKKIIKR